VKPPLLWSPSISTKNRNKKTSCRHHIHVSHISEDFVSTEMAMIKTIKCGARSLTRTESVTEHLDVLFKFSLILLNSFNFIFQWHRRTNHISCFIVMDSKLTSW
jgi:hypothetical protein